MLIAPFIFGSALAFALYVMLGYPAILAVLARYRSRPVRKRWARRTVSIIIPVHNGARFVEDKLRSVLELDYPRELLEILVVSDGSTDGTDEIVRNFGPRGVRILRVDRFGKPAAINAAIPETRGDILVFTDVRQTLTRDSLSHLVRCFEDERVGVVSGNLKIRPGRTLEEQGVSAYWRYEMRIRGMLAAIDSMFGAVGPYYAMRRTLAAEIPREQLLDDVYLPMHAFLQGYRLILEPNARALDYPMTIGTEFKRKVRTLAGNYQIIRAFPMLLGPRNRMWFHFWSYKVGRLLLPYTLLVLFASGLFLPGNWRLSITAAQIVFYAAAAMDRWMPARSRVKRLTSPARIFTALLMAAVVALRVFFVEPQKLWRETKVTLPSDRAPDAQPVNDRAELVS